MRIRRVATAALVVFLVCVESQARTLDQVPPYLEKEGKFVSYPALAMGGLGAVVGTVVSLPAVAIAAPIGWAAGDSLGYALVPASVVATGGAEVGYHIGGAIPWALKNVFYDAPMTAVARIKGDPASGLVAQVEPPPATNGDIQYLDTTPTAARVPVALAQQYSSALPPPKPPTSLMLRRQLSPFKAPVLPARGAAARPAAPAQVPPVALAPRPAPVLPAPVTISSQSAAPLESPQPQTALTPAIVMPPPAPVLAPPPVIEPAVSAEPPAPVVVPPPVVAAAPVEIAPPPVVADLVSEPPPVAVEAPVAEDVQAEGESFRPALKKKRKFSERFSF